MYLIHVYSNENKHALYAFKHNWKACEHENYNQHALSFGTLKKAVENETKLQAATEGCLEVRWNQVKHFNVFN